MSNEPQLDQTIFGDQQGGGPDPRAEHAEPAEATARAGEPGVGEPAAPEPAAGEPATPDPPAEGAPGRRWRSPRRRTWLVLLLTLALVAGAGFAAVQVLRPMVSSITASNDYSGAGTGSVSVVVRAGDSGRAIGVELEKAGVVKTAGAFADAASGNPRAAAIQPGTYHLRQRMSAASALTMLLDPGNRSVPTVTIREGLWQDEIFALLSRSTGQPLADYRAAAKTPQALGLPASAKGHLDGYLFPATYSFGPTMEAAAQLKAMVDKTLEVLHGLGVEPADANRVLTVASIVEGEAARPQDRPKVARVIVNRLHDKVKLQMDSTVHYAGHRRGGVTTSQAERASRSPYNTYRVQGLPPAPINSPGASSIKAALHPAKGTWKYFVTVNPKSGETRFATTWAQHQANVALFQQWCSAHKGEC